MLMLKPGLSPASTEIGRWQSFLIGRGYKIQMTNYYDEATVAATRKYQRENGLIADGIVGNRTLALAVQAGFALFPFDQESTNKKSQYWPTKPWDLKVLSNAEREKIFGKFDYTPKPTPRNAEAIVIDPAWVKENIVNIEVPIDVFHRITSVKLHKLAKEPFLDLLDAWRKKGVIHLIDVWNGGFVPRFKRGRAVQQDLSNHSWGTAFDINAHTNAMGIIPPLVGEEGSVRELVLDANKLGWFWGGHYNSRQDGMHFELCRL